jgi:hypothetical protein
MKYKFKSRCIVDNNIIEIPDCAMHITITQTEIFSGFSINKNETRISWLEPE